MIIDLKKHLENKFTIITALYKPDFKLFKRCYESVFRQSNKDFTWIISLDGYKTLEMVNSFGNLEPPDGINLKIIHSKKHVGVSAARNRALDMVSSGYIGFLDGDNWIHESFVEIAKKLIQDASDNKEKTLIAVDQAIVHSPPHYHGTEHYAIASRPAKPLDFMSLASGPMMDLGQIIHNSLDIRFDTSLTRLVDYEYMINLMYSGQIMNQYTVDFCISFYDHFKRDNRINDTIPYKINIEKINKKWKKSYEAKVMEIFQQKMLEQGIQTQGDE